MSGERSGSEAPARKPGAVTRVVGSALILAGIPLLVLPGPGLVLIGAGLGMLGWNRVRGSREQQRKGQQTGTEEGPRQ